MSNIVSTLTPMKETELTDEQLVSINGAWGDVREVFYGGGDPRRGGCDARNADSSCGGRALYGAPAVGVPSFTDVSFHQKHSFSIQLSIQQDDEESAHAVSLA